MKLCSAYDELTHLSCDLPEGHEGDHEATAYWGNDGDEDA